MAEVIVNMVIEKLIALLQEEKELPRSVHREVEDIKLELEFISSFLKDADVRAAREESNNGVKTWVKHVREAAYSIEDAIDEYIFHVTEAKQSRHHEQGFKAFLTKISCWIKNMRRQREMASKIQELKQSVHLIGKKRKRYGFNVSEQRDSSHTWDDVKCHDPRAGLHFVEHDALVGIEHAKIELIDRLIHGAATRSVVSLVGMGGIGKTTLAKKIYDDQTVRGHFDCHAWITVSQSYNVMEQLRTMIRRFYEVKKELPPYGIDAMDKEELIGKSREYLLDKRYVVVFDDVWNEDFWQHIEYALPENNNGIRIIITTRSMSVANFCQRSSLVHVHKLEPFSLEMAQELLCRTAFRFDQQKECPPELKDLSYEIVKKCEGLPLAIVAIGGLLSAKGKDILQWVRLRNNVSAQLESEPHLTYVRKILSFSYLELPDYLKYPFLYVGLFPRSYSIRSRRLIRLWIAEGLIKEKQEMTLEEVAQEYLTMLIQRSLIQVEWSDSTGRVRTCRVHDLMYEVVCSNLQELNLIQSSQVHITDTNGTTRHLSVYDEACDLSRTNGSFQTHSVLFFSLQRLPTSLFTILSLSFKLLRELDFERAPLKFIPEELGNLLNLRYLSLRETKVKMLPKSIGKLRNLQILDLKYSFVQELPTEISSLHNLLHLIAYSVDFDNYYNIHSVQGVKINGCVIKGLKSLEKLYQVDLQAQNGEDFFSEFGRLRGLRKLGITKLKSEGGMALCEAIKNMHHLQSLQISSENEILQLQSLSSPPVSLQRIRLHGRLGKLPDWISISKNLIKICLNWSSLSDDFLEVMESLPSLLELWLYDAYDGAELNFEEGQFKKLKVLGLRELKGLKTLTIDKGSLDRLEHFVLGPSPYMEEVPTSICNLKHSLQTLEFYDMPKEFARKMLPPDGPDYWKVEKIPTVRFVYIIKGRQCDTYKLGDSRLYKYLC